MAHIFSIWLHFCFFYCCPEGYIWFCRNINSRVYSSSENVTNVSVSMEELAASMKEVSAIIEQIAGWKCRILVFWQKLRYVPTQRESCCSSVRAIRAVTEGILSQLFSTEKHFKVRKCFSVEKALMAFVRVEESRCDCTLFYNRKFRFFMLRKKQEFTERMSDKLLQGNGNKTTRFRRYKNLLHQLRQQTSRLHLRNNPYPEDHLRSCGECP